MLRILLKITIGGGLRQMIVSSQYHEQKGLAGLLQRWFGAHIEQGYEFRT